MLAHREPIRVPQLGKCKGTFSARPPLHTGPGFSRSNRTPRAMPRVKFLPQVAAKGMRVPDIGIQDASAAPCGF